MLKTIRRAVRLGGDARAVTSLEYGIIAAVMTAIGLAGFSIVGDSVFNIYGPVKATMSSDSAGGTITP
jgi:Flp pilus assembly pilin Flp